jgi:hypothetical protein
VSACAHLAICVRRLLTVSVPVQQRTWRTIDGAGTESHVRKPHFVRDHPKLAARLEVVRITEPHTCVLPTTVFKPLQPTRLLDRLEGGLMKLSVLRAPLAPLRYLARLLYPAEPRSGVWVGGDSESIILLRGDAGFAQVWATCPSSHWVNAFIVHRVGRSQGLSLCILYPESFAVSVLALPDPPLT